MSRLSYASSRLLASTVTDILYLVHRLPFPPNKGDKIRSFHLLKHLSELGNVHLGCFVDDPDDWQYVSDVEKFCKTSCIQTLNPLTGRLRSLTAFASGKPLTNPYYWDGRLARWVNRILDEGKVSAVVAFSSPMAQFVLGEQYSQYRRIMDFVDIDSDKWSQYAHKTRGLKRWIYAREARLLARFEKTVTSEFDAAIFVSENETGTFAREAPEFSDRLYTVCNGVAVDYFDPAGGFVSPFDDGTEAVVFTGMMDYWPNVEAMCWFAKSVFPAIREARPATELWIVGASPTKEVTQLTSANGVRVTGRVPDVRPYLANAGAVVAPLRIARGVQNKVLEALAMNKSVVCSPQAAAGLNNARKAPLRIAESETEFVDQVLAVLEEQLATAAPILARNYVLQNYDWDSNLELFERLIHPGVGQATDSAGCK